MGRFDVDPELVRKLARLLEETGLGEIELKSFGRSLRVAREGAAAPAAAAEPAAKPAPEAARPAVQRVGTDHPGAVTSPMVGTLYVAPEPGTPPFVAVGDMVKKGQTLFIIEAMKTMNPVPAPKAGKVAKILAANEAPVEYGEVLLILE